MLSRALPRCLGVVKCGGAMRGAVGPCVQFAEMLEVRLAREEKKRLESLASKWKRQASMANALRNTAKRSESMAARFLRQSRRSLRAIVSRSNSQHSQGDSPPPTQDRFAIAARFLDTGEAACRSRPV